MGRLRLDMKQRFRHLGQMYDAHLIIINIALKRIAHYTQLIIRSIVAMYARSCEELFCVCCVACRYGATRGNDSICARDG